MLHEETFYIIYIMWLLIFIVIPTIAISCYFLLNTKERKAKAMKPATEQMIISDAWENEFTVKKTPRYVVQENMGVMADKVKDTNPYELVIQDGSLQKHVDLLAKKKLIFQTEVVKLAQELTIVAKYRNTRKVYIANCKIAIKLDLTDGYVDMVFSIKHKGGDKHETTWRDLVNTVLLNPDMEKTLYQGCCPLIRTWKKFFGRGLASFASISINRFWEIDTSRRSAKFPACAIKLLGAYRLLVQEKLEELYRETASDLEYIEGMVLSGEDGT